MLHVWTLLSVAAAWSGSLHKKGIHAAKLRSHDKHLEVYGLRTAHGTHGRTPPKITRLHTKAARPSKHVFKTSPPALSVTADDFYPLGLGRCVYKGGLAINSTDYQHIAGATDLAVCKEACKNHADCKALYADAYGCLLFMNDKRQVRAATAGSVEKTSAYCWAKSKTYALAYPFHGAFSPELKFLQCAEINDLAPYLDLPQYLDASLGVGTAEHTRAVSSCAVACAPYPQYGGKFFVGDDQCFCGDATSIGDTVDLSSCGTADDTYVPTRYSGTPNTYAQYSVRYPQLGEDCPDGDRNIPSRYVKSGDWMMSGAALLTDASWTEVPIDMALGDGCAYLCAGVCNEHGASCHGYICVTPQSTSPFLWFPGVNEDSWDGHDSLCYIALNTPPLLARPPNLAPRAAWKHKAVVCARRDCLERTVCASKDFHRVSGYVFPDSADLIEHAVISNCAQCSEKCLEKDTCFAYQCSESLATAYGASTMNCLLFKSYDPEGLQAFNVTDVAVCRRVASDMCAPTDGVTPVGSESCACGSTTCLGGNHNVSMACYIDPEHPTGVCLQLPQYCPEGEVRANSTGSACECVSKLDCDAEPACFEAAEGECAPTPRGCETHATEPCPSAPLAAQCVHCSDGRNETVDSTCAALCDVSGLKSTCPGNITVTSGPCGEANDCTSATTADDLVCGSDSKEYASQCFLTAANGTLANAGECITNCTHLSDSDCHCGTGGEFCDATKAEYCSGGASGTCVTVCNPQQPLDSSCICSTGGMDNATFCTTDSGSVTYCPPSSTAAPSIMGNETGGCVHDTGCVPSCESISTLEQVSRSCLCESAFCCHNEVCASETNAAAQCTKVCETAGEAECTCIQGDLYIWKFS